MSSCVGFVLREDGYWYKYDIVESDSEDDDYDYFLWVLPALQSLWNAAPVQRLVEWSLVPIWYAAWLMQWIVLALWSHKMERAQDLGNEEEEIVVVEQQDDRAREHAVEDELTLRVK